MISLDRFRWSKTGKERTGVVRLRRPSRVHDVEDESLPVDQVFGLLKNGRRRLVLAYVGQRDAPIAIEELAEYVAASEHDEVASQLDTEKRRRTYVSLYHGHLPMMDDLDAVDFDASSRQVAAGERFQTFERYLEPKGGREPAVVSRWNKRYLVLSALGVVLFGSGFLVADPLFTRTAFGVLVGAFVACSLLDWRASSRRGA
jgi:hypothetical protein